MARHRYIITIESDSEDTEAIIREITSYAAECDWDGYRTTPGGKGATTEIRAYPANNLDTVQLAADPVSAYWLAPEPEDMTPVSRRSDPSAELDDCGCNSYDCALCHPAADLTSGEADHGDIIRASDEPELYGATGQGLD